jgi:hypothetical protein
MLYNRSDTRRLQQNISKSGILFYVVVGSYVRLRPLYHTYHMSFLSDATITALPRLYLWAAQLLHETNEIEFSLSSSCRLSGVDSENNPSAAGPEESDTNTQPDSTGVGHTKIGASKIFGVGI